MFGIRNNELKIILIIMISFDKQSISLLSIEYAKPYCRSHGDTKMDKIWCMNTDIDNPPLL